MNAQNLTTETLTTALKALARQMDLEADQASRKSAQGLDDDAEAHREMNLELHAAWESIDEALADADS